MKIHKNKKITLGGKKYRVGALMKMTDEELQSIWTEVQKDIDPEKLEWLYFQYQENLKRKAEGLPYGSDLYEKNNDENGEEMESTSGPTI